MMALRKPAPLTGLVEKINAFTSSYRIEGDPYLDGLREAIETKKNLHIWAELDPLDYLPHPEAKAHQSRSRLVRIITVIRNVLVFAPVALTWAAVGQATTGFSRNTLMKTALTSLTSLIFGRTATESLMISGRSVKLLAWTS
jgi:hypothetical protein